MNEKRIQILDRIKKVCAKISRNENEIKLLAVSKKQPVEKILKMYELGQRDFAENYVQEFLEKKESLTGKNIEWHMIGPLQTNKVAKIIGEVELIHSIDSLKLAKFVSEKSKEKNITQKILLQINVANEASKSGVDLKHSKSFIEDVLKFSNIKVTGLMAMPPFTDNPEDSRIHFENLRKIRDDFKELGIHELSMGTTQDFEVAIEEGATIIRVGEALFGPR
jgi:pyridoxal phosphate enzyme (YggS family)